MEAVGTVVGKVAVIMLLIVVGYFVTKRGIFTERGASEVTTLLIKLVTPCVIVNSFLGSTDTLGAYELLMAMALPALWMAAALGISLLAFRKEPPERQKVVFADASGELAAMASLRRSCLLVGSGGFLAFLGLSILLARWAVGPVDQAWRRQQQFVADASHELKTPLTVILANAELLADPGCTGGERLAGNILTVARQMRSLVERLLELARMDAGKGEAQEPVDLSRLVGDALLPFEPVFFEAGLTLESRVEEGIWVRGSGMQLAQAADILLDNARKYAAPGSAVSLRLERTGRWCLLRVATAGEPLTRQERQDVFKRFYRADPARAREGSCGLGLSIARSIAAAHRGRIWAESGPAGNVFLIRLPVCPKPSGPEAGGPGDGAGRLPGE